MLKALANALMPHYCCSCGRIGAVLCEHCKYDIISESFEGCIVCMRPTPAHSSLCSKCKEPYSRAWCVAERGEALKEAINRYKYDSARAAVDQLVDLLDEIVPILPPETKVVPIPTIAPHIRIRGYDHMALIASRFAARRGLSVGRALIRVGTDHQQGSSRRQRLAQAKGAFRCGSVEAVPHLLIDDVYTTGATLHHAALALRGAGAPDVYVAVLSRQLLEKS